MIGILSKDHDPEIVSEFFELFKTPWEFYNPGHRYDVILAAGEAPPETDAALVIIYAVRKLPSDDCDSSDLSTADTSIMAFWGDVHMPIYGKSIAFHNPAGSPVIVNKTGQVMGYENKNGSRRILRIGYDIFHEANHLLNKGQPAANAMLPTLDYHIAMLRSFIAETGMQLIEIPPIPSGYKFIACLTHDVDFVSIRHHLIDHSSLGFLYRATFGSIIDYMKKKIPYANLMENLKAVLALPFIFSKRYKDPWNQFDHYLDIEQGVPSTFFFIPFKNEPGDGFHENKESYRAAKYDVDDVTDTIRKLLSHGCEAGVHGLDSWHSEGKGRKERDRISQVTKSDKVGIRMHWLSMNDETFRLLDQAGYDYDSTFGFNEAVGFRAATAQVYKPAGVKHLLELPMHVQDTALFGSGRMNMTAKQAEQLCSKILDHIATQTGGVFTLLWHQRSIGPEKLWGDFYSLFLKKLHDEAGWFATAQDAVDWFRIRRSARFTTDGGIHISPKSVRNANLPKLVLRIYNSEVTPSSSCGQTTVPFIDKQLEVTDN